LNWPEISDEKALAERDEILLARMKLPVAKSWLYGRHNVPEPEEGEELFSIAPPTPEPEAEPAAVEAQQASGGRMVMNRPVVDQLTDAVMESVSGEAAVFLAGVRPTFRRLVATALDGSISDADFIATLDSVALSIPEMRSELNTESLQRALEEAIGSGMLAGAGERVISR
jgi:phage gp29-like protein